MAEYIDRDAAIALAKDIIVPTKNGYDYRHRCIDPQDLAELPAADVVERKTGKWTDGKGNLVPWDEMNKNCPNNSAYCSVCGEWLTASDEYPAIGNFCPNCGAKMIGGDDDV